MRSYAWQATTKAEFKDFTEDEKFSIDSLLHRPRRHVLAQSLRLSSF